MTESYLVDLLNSVSTDLKMLNDMIDIITDPKNPYLPNGFEIAKTTDGKSYYINHIAHTTSWVHPIVKIMKAIRKE